MLADLERAVAFYRDVIGLPLSSSLPNGASLQRRNGSCTACSIGEKSCRKARDGFTVPDLQQFHAEMQGKGVQFPMPPKKQDFGGALVQFVDSEGAHVSVSGADGGTVHSSGEEAYAVRECARSACD